MPGSTHRNTGVFRRRWQYYRNRLVRLRKLGGFFSAGVDFTMAAKTTEFAMVENVAEFEMAAKITEFEMVSN